MSDPMLYTQIWWLVSQNSYSSEINCCVSSFDCFYTNAQSIYNFDEFSNTVLETKQLVIGMAETWLKQQIKDVEINLQGYEVFRCDRKEGTGGGALMYLHESLKSSPNEQLDNIEFENAVWRKVKLNGNDSLVIGVIYRSTASDIENNEKLF